MEEKTLTVKRGSLAYMEKQIILQALDYFKGNRTKTAKELDIGVRTIQRKLKEWGVSEGEEQEFSDTVRRIAEFLCESNMIEGYDLPVEDYIKNWDKCRSKNLHIANSIAALKYVMKNKHRMFDAQDVLKLHSIQMAGLLPNRDVGVYRSVAVTVGMKPTPNPGSVPYLMDEWLVAMNEDPLGASPIERHYWFEKIHPFVDGNGRTGRLLWAWHVLYTGFEVFPILHLYASGDDDFYLRRSLYYKDLSAQSVETYRKERHGKPKS